MRNVESVAFYLLILAFVFIESSSTVMVADSNKVTHSIKYTIYENISMVPPKKNLKEELLPKAKTQCLQAHLLLTEGYVKTAC